MAASAANLSVLLNPPQPPIQPSSRLADSTSTCPSADFSRRLDEASNKPEPSHSDESRPARKASSKTSNTAKSASKSTRRTGNAGPDEHQTDRSLAKPEAKQPQAPTTAGAADDDGASDNDPRSPSKEPRDQATTDAANPTDGSTARASGTPQATSDSVAISEDAPPASQTAAIKASVEHAPDGAQSPQASTASQDATTTGATPETLGEPSATESSASRWHIAGPPRRPSLPRPGPQPPSGTAPLPGGESDGSAPPVALRPPPGKMPPICKDVAPTEQATGDVHSSPDESPEAPVAQLATPDLTAKLELNPRPFPTQAPAHAAAPQPAAPPAPSQPPAPPEVHFADTNHQSIVTGVRTNLLPHGGSMQIRLDPPELGALQVTVEMRDGTMNATFQTSNDDATRLLSHSLGQLKTALESQGVTIDKIQVQQAPKDHPSSHTPEDGSQQHQRRDDADARQEQQRREMLRQMWRRISGGRDPIDLVA
jgi:flagellar hook-length control protein FliK